jgi:hypothetical protein
VPEEFDDSWEIYASRVFHMTDNMGRELQTAHGAFWALKTFENVGSEDRMDIEKRRLIHMLLSIVSDLNYYEIRFDVMINRFYRGLKRRIGKLI